MYSKHDPPCQSSHGLPNPCYNIIVEVICHTTPSPTYTTTWRDYCAGVPHIGYQPKVFPKQGDRIFVSGTFVFDNGSQKWDEIHPASDIHSIK